MRAVDHVDARLKACAVVQGKIRGQLTALEHALPAAARWTGEVRQLLIELNAQMHLIKVDLAVDVMTGESAGRTAQEPVEGLELFAMTGGGSVFSGGGQECPRSLRAAEHGDGRIYHDRMMDAAGDHSMDVDPVESGVGR